MKRFPILDAWRTLAVVLIPGRRHRAYLHQVIVGDDLRTDEAALEVGVDLARCLG